MSEPNVSTDVWTKVCAELRHTDLELQAQLEARSSTMLVMWRWTLRP
jgi:hypothetical protein